MALSFVKIIKHWSRRTIGGSCRYNHCQISPFSLVRLGHLTTEMEPYWWLRYCWCCNHNQLRFKHFTRESLFSSWNSYVKGFLSITYPTYHTKTSDRFWCNSKLIMLKIRCIEHLEAGPPKSAPPTTARPTKPEEWKDRAKTHVQECTGG